VDEAIKAEILAILGKPRALGKCVCEAQAKGGFLIMFPDGTIEFAKSRKQADKKCRDWFAADVDSKGVGVGIIEWRT